MPYIQRVSAETATSRARRPQLAPPGACAFCGRAWQRGVVTRSDEHVWGALRHDGRELPASRMSHVAGFATSPAGSSFVEMPTVTTINNASAFHIITREVCKGCNTGWMSRLEGDAKSLILALAERGRDEAPVDLDQRQRRILAMWAQKTAITNELAGQTPMRVATAAIGRWLRDGLPVRGSVVWAGSNERDFWPGMALVQASIGASPHPVPGERQRHALLMMIVYRYLSLLVFIGGDHGELVPVVPPPVPLNRWVLIWPGAGAAGYPPDQALDADELTRTMVDHSAWYPLSPINVFERSPFPPQTINRN